MALVIKGLIIWESKIIRWYVMDMWCMREQKFLDQLSCKISEIMRKKIEMADWRLIWILEMRNFSWVIIVWDLPFYFIFMVQLFSIFLSPLNITKLAAKRPFLNFCSQRESGHWVTQLSIVAKLKEDLMETVSWNALTSISSLVAIVTKGLMIWGSKCHQKQFASGMGWLGEVLID